jgi:hypothetical protein
MQELYPTRSNTNIIIQELDIIELVSGIAAEPRYMMPLQQVFFAAIA